MAWYSIDMPEVSVINGAYHRLCREFQKAFIGAGAPPELALFACRKSSAERRRLYLSPNAGDYVPHLMEDYGAEPCSVPDAGTVTLVYGVPGAKSLLTVPETLSLSKQRDTPAIYPLTRVRHAASSG
jgi:hypothetical protein